MIFLMNKNGGIFLPYMNGSYVKMLACMLSDTGVSK